MSQNCVTSVNDFQKAVKTTVTQRQPAAIIYDSAEKSYTNNRHEKRHDWYDLALNKKIIEENQQRPIQPNYKKKSTERTENQHIKLIG